MHKYFVSENYKLTPSTILITIKRHYKNPKPFLFRPGQYIAISFKTNGRPTSVRCFSIVNPPNRSDIIQFSVRTKGRFTNALAKLKVGDEVDVRGPFGSFIYDNNHLDTVFLAGGIGITPFMSMIEHATESRLHNKITLVYSAHDQNDVPFLERIKVLEKLNPNFKAIFTLSDGPNHRLLSHTVIKGRITSKVIDYATAGLYRQKIFFVCGPSAFMKSMVNILVEKGVPDTRIIIETFNQTNDSRKGQNGNRWSNIYFLSAAGMALATIAVMASDLAKTIAPSSIFDSNNVENLPTLTNSRQDDLDDLVNDLPGLNNNNPSVSSPIPTPTLTSTPTPLPTPKCTTTQSGVMTCI